MGFYIWTDTVCYPYWSHLNRLGLGVATPRWV